MLRDSTIVVRTRSRAILHEKINSWVSYSLFGHGAPLGSPLGCQSSAINHAIARSIGQGWGLRFSCKDQVLKVKVVYVMAVCFVFASP